MSSNKIQRKHWCKKPEDSAFLKGLNVIRLDAIPPLIEQAKKETLQLIL